MMENSMLKVGGQHFRCACGANVFHKGVKPGLWICNGCGTEYADETYDQRKSNADRIRAMNDEELATMLFDYKECNKICIMNSGKHCYEICEEESYILKWLQQPAKED